MSKRAKRTFEKALSVYGNPSSPHAEGRAARDMVEDARVRIARMAAVKADAVLFTSGATEANALAIVGLAEGLHAAGTAYQDLHVLYLPSAHASTRGAMALLKEKGVRCEALIVTDGMLDMARLRAQVRPETVLVALEAVCGETGTRFDTRGVRRVLDEERESGSRIRMHVDAAQLPLAEPFELPRLGADTLSLDAQKVGGVRGIGALLAPRHVPLAPLMKGGEQERGMRPGTEASALAAAFARALEDAADTRARFAERSSGMRARLMEALSESIPSLCMNGGPDTVPHILNISLPGRDTDYVAALMDEAGFAVSTRSACATDSTGSVAVLAFTDDPARASSTLRISWGPETNVRELERFAKALVRAVRFVDETGI